ncbi:MAG: tetratricopeptide repeat protein [Holdemania massiliensis]
MSWTAAKKQSATKRSIKLKPDNAWTYCQLGISYKNIDQLEEAEASLKKGLDMGYADSWPHYQLAVVYNRMEKYEEALKEVPLGFDEEEKDCSDYHWMMARNLGPMGEHREAIVHLRKAKDHDEASLYEEFGWNYSEMELYDKALDYFQRPIIRQERVGCWLSWAAQRIV